MMMWSLMRMPGVITTLIGWYIQSSLAQGCEVGYFKDIDNVCKRCLPNCVSCTNNHSCIGCKLNYYGAVCSYSCLSHCFGGDCTQDGCTRGCNDKYFMNANHICSSCQPKCQSCSSYSQCVTTCKPQPSRAQTNQCYNCQFPCAKCDAHSAKCTQCQRGYYLSNGTCNSCGTGCQICSGESQCSRFNNGLSPTNHRCFQCSSGCKECSSNTNCTKCADGYYLLSRICRKCPSECKTCESEQKCSVCKQGLYGISCENRCSNNCFGIPNSTLCNKQNGSCIIGCTSSHWGQFCNKSCSDGCLHGLCTREHGTCHICKTDKYGDHCNKDCSASCTKRENSSNICRQEDGVCLFGCAEGTSWPTDLNQTVCENCTTNRSPSSSQADNNHVNKGAVIGAVVGAVGVIILGCVTVMFLARRSNRAWFNTINCFLCVKVNSGSDRGVGDTIRQVSNATMVKQENYGHMRQKKVRTTSHNSDRGTESTAVNMELGDSNNVKGSSKEVGHPVRYDRNAQRNTGMRQAYLQHFDNKQYMDRVNDNIAKLNEPKDDPEVKVSPDKIHGRRKTIDRQSNLDYSKEKYNDLNFSLVE